MAADDYIIPLSIDLTGVVNKIQPVVSGLNSINDAAVKSSNNTKAAFDSVNKSADAVGKKVAGATSVINKQIQSVDQLKDRMKLYDGVATAAMDPKRLVEYNRKVEAIEDSINKLKNAGKRGFDELGNKIDDNSKKVNLFQSTLAKAATFLTVAFAVRELISFGKEILDVTAKTEGVQRAFDRINAPGLLDGLRKATRGTVSDLELMQKAVLANQFDIPIKQLASFYEFASKRARDLGVDTEKFVNDVIAGTARGSVRILDNLGISQQLVRQEVKKTGDFATAVFNIVELELAKSGKEADTTADKFGRIGATITNIEANLGKSSTGILSSITGLVQSQLDLINDFVIGLDGKLEALGKKFATTNNTKLIESFKGDTAEGRASALRGYDLLIQKQEQALNGINQKIATTANDLNIIQRIGRAAFTNLNEANDRERDGAVVYLAQLKAEKESLLGVVDQETQSERKAEEARLKNADKVAQRNRQLIAERKSLNDQLTKLTNDYYSAEIDSIEDATQKAVFSENVKSKNRVRELEAQKQDLKERSALFPELAKQYAAVTKQIDDDIVQEKSEHLARIIVITDKAQEEELKLKQQSIKDIASVLKKDNDAQIDAINEKYNKIIADAKKAGTLTTEVEINLAIQRSKEVTAVIIKTQREGLDKQEDMMLSAIYASKKKEGETQVQFERDNQIAVLNVQIEFAKQKLALIKNDPDKAKEINDLTAAIYKMQNALKGLKEEKTGDLFEFLGLDGDKIGKIGKQISVIGETFAGLFNSLADGASARVDEINSQIDAVDNLIEKDQEAVDREQELANQGRANDLATAQKKLNDDKNQKSLLQRQAEEAQAKENELKKAAIIADSFAQASNLITASTEIFKSVSSIPFVGVGLAIGLIATMLGGFAIAKVNALNAVSSQTAAEGGTAGGKLHSEGGNKYVSMDGNDKHILEIERGEEIVRRSSSAKHRRLIKAINKDDFSGINMGDLSEILAGSGILSHIEVATKTASHNNYLQEKSQSINIDNSTSEALLRDIKNILKSPGSSKEVIDMGEYLIIKEGNTTTKIYKQ